MSLDDIRIVQKQRTKLTKSCKALGNNGLQAALDATKISTKKTEQFKIIPEAPPLETSQIWMNKANKERVVIINQGENYITIASDSVLNGNTEPAMVLQLQKFLTEWEIIN